MENYTHMKKYLICLLTTLVCSASAWAVMASPEPFEYTKPDGTKVMARVYGDEFHSFIESLDGELLEGRRDIEAMEQGAQRRSAARRIQKGAGLPAFTPFGSPRSLVLLVSFSDLDFEQSREDFQDLLNKSGYNYNGATGSCRDYYIASSDSLFMPQFDCYGPFKVSRNMAYYGEDEGDRHDIHSGDMVAEACQLAHDAGVNFKDYDVNGDGLLDNVFIYYAGNNQAEGAAETTIWPHQGNITYKNIRLDGVLVNSYACTSEYKGRSKTRCGIGTFCHEFGHVIGQPDFYDTGYNYYSIGNWSIMCQGSYNNDGNTPPTFNAYERMYEGWFTPKQLELPGRYSLPASTNHAEAFLIAAGTHNLSGKSPNPSEFFILENRNGNYNVWDSGLPGHGMIIWHVDYSASAWTSNTPNNGPTIMRFHLEEANGINWKKRANHEDGRPSDPYPGTMNVTSFLPTLHNGTQLAQPIFNIDENSGVISFTYISEGGSTLRANTDRIEATTTLDDNNKIISWEPQMFELLGTGMDPEQAITLRVNGSDFKIYAGESTPMRTSSNWKTTLSIHANTDSTIQQPIWVSYAPKKRNCSSTNSILSITASTASLSIALTGYAPRHTYVTTPQTLACSEITPYSFVANWQNVEDAECYYFTLYQVSDGETSFTQGFENFDSYDKIHEIGWESNTNLTTTSDKKDGTRALYFKNFGDQITSETYPTPVTKMSFWYNSFISTTDTIGVLIIEAHNGTDWELIENKVLTNRAKRETSTYEFEEEKNYRSFRMTWMDNGGSGIAFDAFTATTSKQINYIYKGRDAYYVPYETSKTHHYTFTQLTPNNTYYYQIQCSDLDKGCEEHITTLSDPIEVITTDGKPLDGSQLTIAYDSINYTPATHAIYITNAKNGDYLNFYNTEGGLVYSLPVEYGMYIYPLDLNRFNVGEVYLVQHAIGGKLGRKNKWLKFVF